jgi:translation elongation factor EF-Tu-like GTPase
MKIDRISTIVGRGTLVEGRVVNGTLVSNSSVEIFGPSSDVIRPALLAILISNTVRDQVKIGEYASLLIGGVEATRLSPGMYLTLANEFKSYEELLLQLK